MSQKPVAHLGTLLREFFLMGLVSFGGGMFSLIYERIVHQHQWMTEEEFQECVTCSELAPGPFTLHVVMYIGYHLHRLKGLLLSTLFFSLPSILIVTGIALFERFFLREIPAFSGFITGVWATIFALMGSTILTIGKKVFRDPLLLFLTVATMGLIILFQWNYFLLILLSGFSLVVLTTFRELKIFQTKSLQEGK